MTDSKDNTVDFSPDYVSDQDMQFLIDNGYLDDQFDLATMRAYEEFTEHLSRDHGVVEDGGEVEVQGHGEVEVEGDNGSEVRAQAVSEVECIVQK